jgi:sporulation protein YlmC with PRC-barrel domain
VRLDLGCPVHCSDGAYGELVDVVVDPTTRRVTNLVVRPHGHDEVAMLVPADRAREGDGPGITLELTVAEVGRLEPVRRSAYLRLGEFPVDDPAWDVGIEDVLAMPYYRELDGVTAIGPDYDTHVTVRYDRVPKGDVELRRESAVRSSDEHHVGHVDGFVVDDEDHITHVVLEAGHLWGKREITIPIGAIASIESDVAVLSLTKDQVGELDAVRVHRWRR